MIETLDGIAQYALFFLSVLSMFLVARKNKWGFVAGLASQPFWLFTSYVNDQVGVFLNTIVFTCFWIYGIYRWFFVADGVAAAPFPSTPVDEKEKIG